MKLKIRRQMKDVTKGARSLASSVLTILEEEITFSFPHAQKQMINNKLTITDTKTTKQKLIVTELPLSVSSTSTTFMVVMLFKFIPKRTELKA